MHLGLPGSLDGKESGCNAGDVRDFGSIPGLGRSPGGGQPSPVFLPGESHVQRSLVGYSPCGHKESDMTEQLGTVHHHFMDKKLGCIISYCP